MSRKLLLVVTAMLVVAVTAAGLYAYLSPQRGSANVAEGRGVIVAAPVGGAFTLVDHTGRTVTDETFRGRYLLVFFGFTNCPDVCPLALDRFAQVLELLGPDASMVQPALISVDPERDTPEALADYVAGFDKRILGLTGTPEQIAVVVKAYRAYARKDAAAGAGDYGVDHSSFEYLMGPDGQNVYVFTNEATPERIAEAIRSRLDA